MADFDAALHHPWRQQLHHVCTAHGRSPVAIYLPVQLCFAAKARHPLLRCHRGHESEPTPQRSPLSSHPDHEHAAQQCAMLPSFRVCMLWYAMPIPAMHSALQRACTACASTSRLRCHPWLHLGALVGITDERRPTSGLLWNALPAPTAPLLPSVFGCCTMLGLLALSCCPLPLSVVTLLRRPTDAPATVQEKGSGEREPAGPCVCRPIKAKLVPCMQRISSTRCHVHL